MDMFLVQLSAKPTKGSAEFNEVGGATVDIFVQSPSLNEAATLAIDYLMSRSWVVTEQSAVLLMTPERIASLDEIQTSTYHQALSEGLYSFFAAWPVQDREDDHVEIRPLRDSDSSSGSKH